MAFVRAKVVEGHTYYQLVHNYREAGKHRQKVLFHLGKHSFLDQAVEDKSREEEEFRNKTAELFRETTEIKQDILDRHGEIIGREIPSWNKTIDMLRDAQESYEEYKDYSYDHPEHRKRLNARWDRYRLSKDVRKYEDIRWEARWYDDRANKAQEKKDKLAEFKEQYPHL